MSQKNEIAINIPAEVLATINSLVSQLKLTLAPYIHALTSEEIAGIAKMGDKTLAFVEKVKDYTVSNPEFVPTDLMNVNDFYIDFEAVKTLMPVLKSVEQIKDDLKDSLILSGNEAYLPALMYYRNVKSRADAGVPSAKTIYDDLKKRFPGKTKAVNPSVAS